MMNLKFLTGFHPIVNIDFNIIDIKKDCPKCGAKVEWQTKDLVIDKTYPIENILRKYILNKKMSCEAHTSCDKCDAWSEVKIISGKLGKIKSGKSNKLWL